MKYREALSWLDAHIELGWKPGLERIRLLAEMMGSPHLNRPSIHITGTNGKTTVTTIAASLLDSMGIRSGAFTSPHLETVEERLRIGGVSATPEQLARAMADVAPFDDLLEETIGERATYFELITAAALAHFDNACADVAVVEVGMGGRLDATNILQSQVAVLTGVAMDHMDYLGDTETQIASEKLAILKPGGVLVTGEVSADVAIMAEKVVAERSTVRRAIGRDFRLEDLRMSVGGWSFDIEGIYDRYEDLYLPMHGRHQAANAAVAVTAVEELLGRALPIDAVRDGLGTVSVAGRAEIAGKEPLVLLDGAHNPQSADALAITLRQELPSTGWTLVFGAFADKDIDGILAPLQGLVDRAVATAADHDRAAHPDQVAKALTRSFNGIPVRSSYPVRDAVESAQEWSGPDGAVLVTGSFYIVGEARLALGREKSASQQPLRKSPGNRE